MSEITQQTQELVNATVKELVTVESLTITCPAEYEKAGNYLKQVKGRYQQIDKERKAILAPLNETKQRIQDFFNPPLERLAKAETVLKHSIASWTIEQQRILAEQERHARELAAKEQDRLDAEAQQNALQAEQSGNHNQAEEILATVPQVSMPVIESVQAKVEGVSMRDNWKYRITNANEIPREFLIPDDKKLTQYAKMAKNTMTVSGVEFYNDQIVVSKMG
jgi:vacuolar-type H+-ATPase subunit H